MEGVDQADQNIATYWIAIKIKTWWWAFFPWIPDMVLQNVWILYRINTQTQDPNLYFLVFRREIVDIYLKKCLSRPSGRILPTRHRVKDEICLDRGDHFSGFFMTQVRCGFSGKNKTRMQQM